MKNTTCCFDVVKDDVLPTYTQRKMNGSYDTSFDESSTRKEEGSFKRKRETFIGNEDGRRARKVLLYIEGFLSSLQYLAISIEN